VTPENAPHPLSEPATGRTLLSRRALEAIAALLVLAFGAVIVYGALEFDVGWDDRGPGTGYFPFWVGIVVLIGGVGALAEGLLKARYKATPALSGGQLQRASTFLLPILGFLAITSFLGIYVGMTVYLLFVMLWQGGYRLPMALSVSIGTAAFFFVMFEKLLKVGLMKGPLEAWLGIH
jgi:hypothetical protein